MRIENAAGYLGKSYIFLQCFIKIPSKIDQNGCHERSKNDPGSKSFWIPPKTRYGGVEIATFERHLADLGRHFGPQRIPTGAQKSHIFVKTQHKLQKNEVQEGISKKHDFWMDFDENMRCQDLKYWLLPREYACFHKINVSGKWV